MEYISKIYLSLSQFDNMYYMFIEDINEGFHFILHSNHVTIICSCESLTPSFIAPFSPPSFVIAFLHLSINHISMIVLMTNSQLIQMNPFQVSFMPLLPTMYWCPLLIKVNYVHGIVRTKFKMIFYHDLLPHNVTQYEFRNIWFHVFTKLMKDFHKMLQNVFLTSVIK